MTGGRPTVLVLVPTEFLQVDPLSVNHHAHVVIIPSVNLVEVKLEQDKVGVGRNSGVRLVSGFAPGVPIIPTEELGEGRRGVDFTVVPTGELAVLKVFEGHDLGWRTNLDGRSRSRSRSG